MLLCIRRMSALSLSPFIAPAAGTIAFLLLLCVSVAAVIALSPLAAGEHLLASGAPTDPGAMSLPATPAGLENAAEIAVHRTSADETSIGAAGLPRDAELPVPVMSGAASDLESDDAIPLISLFDSLAHHAPPEDRWWGINE